MSEEQDWVMRELMRVEEAHAKVIAELREQLAEKQKQIADLQTQLRRLRDEYRRLFEGDL